MLSLQLLIQNLIYDVAQLTIPWDNVDEEVIKPCSVGNERTSEIYSMYWPGK